MLTQRHSRSEGRFRGSCGQVRARGKAPRASAVYRFVDPIAGIAVLGAPNTPHADDYNALMTTATALPIRI
jgi:hypothetical protein